MTQLQLAARLLASSGGTQEERREAAALMGKKGGPRRAEKLTPAERRAIALRAWRKRVSRSR